MSFWVSVNAIQKNTNKQTNKKQKQRTDRNPIRGRGVVTKLHKCPVGTQPCDRNSGERDPACFAVACRRRFLLLPRSRDGDGQRCRASYVSRGIGRLFMSTCLGLRSTECKCAINWLVGKCSFNFCVFLSRRPSFPSLSERPRSQTH